LFDLAEDSSEVELPELGEVAVRNSNDAFGLVHLVNRGIKPPEGLSRRQRSYFLEPFIILKSL